MEHRRTGPPEEPLLVIGVSVRGIRNGSARASLFVIIDPAKR